MTSLGNVYILDSLNIGSHENLILRNHTSYAHENKHIYSTVFVYKPFKIRLYCCKDAYI